MNDRSHLLTEQRLAESMSLDVMSIEDAVVLMDAANAKAVAAVAAERSSIVRAVQMVSDAFKNNGRLIYVGAGTSGRLGVLDASECPPTFRSEPEMVQGIIAGGEAAMFRAQEGAEDNAENGERAIDEKKVLPADVVLGIAAGGTTPFVHGALQRAKQRGAKTIFLTCVAAFAGEPAVDVVIRPLTGPEILTGSTRLKAGTASKIVLNTITTLAMVQIGKAYENLMVDLKASNDKLRDRAKRIVRILTGLCDEDAARQLHEAGGDVKVAVVMYRRKMNLNAAQQLLARNEGRLRRALRENNGSGPTF